MHADAQVSLKYHYCCMCLCRFKSIDFDVLYVLYKHDKMLRVTIISNFVLYALHVRYKGTHAKLTSSPEGVTKVSNEYWSGYSRSNFAKGVGLRSWKGNFGMIVGSWNHLLPIVDYKYMSIHMQRSPFCKALLFSMLGHIRAIRFQPCPQADITI